MGCTVKGKFPGQRSRAGYVQCTVQKMLPKVFRRKIFRCIVALVIADEKVYPTISIIRRMTNLRHCLGIG